jgi:hypothetical protein
MHAHAWLTPRSGFSVSCAWHTIVSAVELKSLQGVVLVVNWRANVADTRTQTTVTNANVRTGLVGLCATGS